MKALITGITGHIGPHLARALIQDGWTVAGLARTTSDRSGLDDLPIEIHYGDIADKESFRKALAGCDACFHLAAPTVVRTPEQTETVLQGVANLCELIAAQPQVRRTVYVSSTVTVGVVADRHAALDESSTMRLTGTRYQETKFDAEQHVLSFLKQHAAVDVVIVNPSTILGPGDKRPTPPDQLVVDFMNYAGGLEWFTKRYFKGAPVWFDAGFSIISVEDAARGIYLAFQRGKRGERYILSGDNITMRAMHRELSRITGSPVPFLFIPKPAMLALAWMLTKLMEHPPMSYRLAQGMVGKYAFFSCEKAERDLGYHPHLYKDVLAETVRWFLQTPLIDASRKKRIQGYLQTQQ